MPETNYLIQFIKNFLYILPNRREVRFEDNLYHGKLEKTAFEFLFDLLSQTSQINSSPKVKYPKEFVYLNCRFRPSKNCIISIWGKKIKPNMDMYSAYNCFPKSNSKKNKGQL